MREYSNYLLFVLLLISLFLFGCSGSSDAHHIVTEDTILSTLEKTATSKETVNNNPVKIVINETLKTEIDNTSIQINNQIKYSKINLWKDKTKLRGANIYQRQVHIELDGETFMGSNYVGPPYVQEDFDKLSKLGANLVVISHPGLFDVKTPYSLNKKIEKNLDDLLLMIEKANMFAVIAFRSGPGRSEFTFYIDEVGDWFDSSYLDDSVWKSSLKQDKWVEMWKYVANKYKNNKIVVGYHLMVEPNSDEVIYNSDDAEDFYSKYSGEIGDWNMFYPKIVNGIRTVDSNTPIIVGGMGYSAINWLEYITISLDKKIVYTVHQYSPISYTHQTGNLKIKYPGNYDIDWDEEKDNFNKNWIDNTLGKIDKFKLKNSKPVAITEFGLIRYEPGSVEFMKDQIELLEKRGLNHAVWMWAPSWEQFNEENDDFDFMHGTDKNNYVYVENSLLNVIKNSWSKNLVRPSNYN